MKSISSKIKKKPHIPKWILTVFISTILISCLFSYISDLLLSSASLFFAFLILFIIIIIGILFDIVGVAVAAADEKPFHSMASNKVPEAADALNLIRNAAHVGSICNDVIGDICGIVSGSAAAYIAIEIATDYSDSFLSVIRLILSALVAGLTVGGKACGKSFAIRNSTHIIQIASKIIHVATGLFSSIKLRFKGKS